MTIASREYLPPSNKFAASYNDSPLQVALGGYLGLLLLAVTMLIRADRYSNSRTASLALAGGAPEHA